MNDGSPRSTNPESSTTPPSRPRSPGFQSYRNNHVSRYPWVPHSSASFAHGKQKHTVTSIAPANPRQTSALVDPAPTAPAPWEKYPAANHPDAAENSSHPHSQK